MRSLQLRMLKPLVAGVLAALVLALPSAAQAAEPGQLCRSQADWVVYQNSNGTGFLYYIYYNQFFRIDDYGNASYYFGHTSGQPSGYVAKWVINESTCYWT